MKKKFVVLLLLLCLVCCLTLSSCLFVKENDERVAASVVCTVSYDYKGSENFPAQELTLDITRNELLSYVNYIIYLYSQYQMDYDIDEILEDGLESLRTQKYQMLKAMEYLMNETSAERQKAMYYFTDEYKAIYGTEITCEGLLTIAERYQAIADTNADFQDSIDSYIEDYYEENRELEISTAKDTLAALYADGYTVKEEDGIAVAHVVDEDADSDEEKYEDGLYQYYFNTDFDDVETDKVYIKITLVKEDSDDVVVYCPASDSNLSFDDDEETNNNPRLTNRILYITYQEPTTTTTTTTNEDGEEETTTTTSYIEHSIEVKYIKVSPRNAIEKDDNGDEVVETIDYLDGEGYNYRYKTEFTTEEELEFVENGAIFEINKSNLTAAEKDAYRQFKEAKKNQLIGFDETDTIYNGLGYYYQQSFQSAITAAVKHELALSAYDSDPITDDDITEQFKNLATKQKEEYDLLSQEEQVAKFAETIGTNLESCYYIPLDALKNTTYTYTDSNGVEHTKAYAVENEDGTYTIDMFYIAHILFKFDENYSSIMERVTSNLTEEDEIKQLKLDLINAGLFQTNESNPDYLEIKGEKLQDAYTILVDENDEPILDEDGHLQLLSIDVVDVYNNLLEDLDNAEDNDAKLEVFKDYMTRFNDDSGSLTSNIGYFIGMGDIEHSYDGEDFPNAAKSIYIDYLEDGIIDEFTQLSFTSYGLHVECISFMPFDKVTINDLGSGLYTLDINTPLDITGENTFKTTLNASLLSTQESDAYSEWTSDLTSDVAEENSELFDKVLKKIKKDLDLE